MFNKLRNIKFKRPRLHDLDRLVQSIFQIIWRVAVLVLIVGFLLFVYRSMQDESYSIQSFHVPNSFEEAGFDGIVLSQNLADELEAVDAYINSQKERDTDVQSGLQPDLNVEVMGIGLTLNSVTYHMRKLFNKQNNTIGGELTDIDQKLKLTIRVSPYPPMSAEQKYEIDDREAALKIILHEGAKSIMGKIDPYRMAVYHNKKGEYEESMNYIMYVLNNRPEEEQWAYLAWSSWLHRQGRKDESLEKLQKAVDVKEDFFPALLTIGWRYFQKKQYEKAAEIFKQAHRIDPSRATALNGLAICHRELGETEKANYYYAKTVEADSKSIWWYGNWADFRYRIMKDTVGAVEIFERAKKNIPESAELYMSIAGVYAYKNQIDSAIIFSEKALDVEPNNYMALQRVARHYYNNAKEYKKANEVLHRLTQALESEKYRDLEERTYNLQNAYNLLAMTDYQLMQYDSALQHVRIAINLIPEFSYPYSTLAETYAFMGKREEFYDAIEQGIERGFDFAQYAEDVPYNKYSHEDRFQMLIRKKEDMVLKN